MNAGLKQQVLGRVAGERQLGEGHQLGAEARARSRQAISSHVALEVADGGIDLGQRDPEAAHGDDSSPSRRSIPFRGPLRRPARTAR